MPDRTALTTNSLALYCSGLLFLAQAECEKWKITAEAHCVVICDLEQERDHYIEETRKLDSIREAIQAENAKLKEDLKEADRLLESWCFGGRPLEGSQAYLAKRTEK